MRRSSGLIAHNREGNLLLAGAARIPHEEGFGEKIGSFLVGLGYRGQPYESAALFLLRVTPQGIPDSGFGRNGSVTTPLLPRKNRDSAAVTALVVDERGRTIVVGWRTLSTWLDASVPVIFAARYTCSGELDTSFGDRGIVTTRIDKAGATQAYAAAVDGSGRLLVVGYNGGGKERSSVGSFDDWPVRAVLLRYTDSGVLDTSFGVGGIASRVIVPSGSEGQAGRDFLLYDSDHIKAAGLLLDGSGRAVVAVAGGEGPMVLMRYTQDGVLDSRFGSAGVVQTPLGKLANVAALSWDAEGRLIAAGTSDGSSVLLRFSADGVLDATFGESGMCRTPLSEGLRVSAALPDRDGHLLVVASGKNSVQLSRYDPEGRPDASFGSNGTINTTLDRNVAPAAGLAIDENGIPVVAVVSGNGIVTLRYNRGGAVGQSFQALPQAAP